MTATAQRTPKSQAQTIRVRAGLLLEREIAFIDHASFRRLKLADVSELKSPIHMDESHFRQDQRLPTCLTPLFRTPLLTLEGEQHLFRKMNFCRYRANRLRSELDPKRPKRQTVEEIESLLALADESRRILVESNLRLVASIARKLVSATIDFDELLSEGNVVLVYAIDKFDFSRGFRFSTYATHAVQRHLYRVIQRFHRRQTREVITDQEILSESLTATDEHLELEEEFPADFRKRMHREIQSGLDSRERRILRERFGLVTEEESTLKDLAHRMGLSKERVRQLQHRAIAKLRELLGVTLGENDSEEGRLTEHSIL